MRRRVIAAAGGGAIGAVVLAAILVTAPWRPTGWLVGLALMGIVVPATAAACVALALRRTDPREVREAARLAAIGTPVVILLVLFCINVVAVTRVPGAQQIAALVIGMASASALAARFTATGEDDG